MHKIKVKQKLTVVLFLVIILFSFSAGTAFAAQSGTVTSSDIKVSLYGWVDFVRGTIPIITPDLLFYNANAIG